MDKLVGMLRSFLPELLLMLAVGLLLLLNIGAFEIDPFSEFFHIQSARESLASGHFALPIINGHDYLIRAPFWTWIVMGFFKLMGVSLLAARIPAVICTLLGLAFTYMLTMELTQSRFSALFAAATLATTWGYFHGGSLSTADILVTVIYTAFAWAFIQWHSFAARKNTIPLEMKIYSAGLGALLGLLVLVKGTMPVLLLLIIAGSYLVFTRSTALARKLHLSLIIGPLVLIPLPWLIIASIQSGNATFMWDFLFNQSIERMLGTGPWAALQLDWLFYLKRFPMDTMPYLLLLPAILLDTDMFNQRGNSQTPPWALWLLFWFGLGLLVNSISVFHVPTMMLPFMPPMAALVGFYLGRIIAYIGLIMLAAVLCAVLIFQVVPSDYVTGYWHFPGQAVIETLKLGKHEFELPEAFPLWKFWLIPGPFILLIGGFILYVLQSERRMSLTPVTLVGLVMVFLLFIKALYMPIMYRPVPEAFARRLNHQVHAQDAIVLYSLHPDIKRMMFYLDINKLAHVRMVRKPDLIEQNISPPKGIMYGVMPEKTYFEDLPFADRNLLQVNHSDWKWDTGNLSELKKFLVIRQPQFDLMKSELLSFQSLPPASQEALQEMQQAEAMLSGEQPVSTHHRKRRSH
jgi:4-amino-4-deoxy-L-arabinose transferase-like glycosyltransferase